MRFAYLAGASCGTHVCCFPKDKRKTALFLLCTRSLGAHTRASLGKPHQRYASQVVWLRSQCQNSGSYQAFGLIQSSVLTLLEPQSRFGDKLLESLVVCPHNGTAVLKGLTTLRTRLYHYHRYDQTGRVFSSRRTEIGSSR